jgi:hypothetical protein
VSVEAGAPEGLGGHRRAAAAAAVEDDRPVAVDRLDLGAQLGQLDEPVAGDPARFVLLGLADVDQLDVAAGEQLSDLLWGVVVDTFRL